MNGQEDSAFTMFPTEVDRQRVKALEVNGRMESENGLWVVIRYPPKARSLWCEYSLIINSPDLPPRPAPYELKNTKALLTFLEQLEEDRLKGKK